jgi:putative membrane protein
MDRFRMAFEDLGNGDKMASMRTSLSFQRTRMSADRTLMSIMRTSLSLIGFGFTIYTFTTNLLKRDAVLGLLRPEAPRRFALTLIALGVTLLALGILNHYRYMRSLRDQRIEFINAGLLSDRHDFPVSLTLITAFLLLLLGLLTAFSIIVRGWPFG